MMEEGWTVLVFLGLGQVDQYGNVNVSKFAGRCVGCGGFINISQNSKKVVFLGTLTAGDLKVSVIDGAIKIIKEGREKKFIKTVEQITFSGKKANKQKQTVFYITERCVFKLQSDGLELVEVAPGIDIQTQILDQMEFKPIIDSPPKVMDKRIFINELMHIKTNLLHNQFTERFVYDEKNSGGHVLYLNLQGLKIRTVIEAKELIFNIEVKLKKN